MPRTIVLNDGVLSAEVVSYEQIELAQLESEVAARQEAYDHAISELVDAPAEAEALVAAATRRDETKAVLEDSKSEYAVASELVANAPLPDGSVPVGVTVADTAAQF